MTLSDIFIFSLNAIMPLICIIILGYVLKCTGFFSKEFLKNGNKLVFRVCLPVMLFVNIAGLESLSGIPWNAVVYVMCIIALFVFIGMITAHFTADPKQKGVMMQCVFRSNFALIGVPLAELISGTSGVTAAAILSAFTIPVYNILAVIVLSVFRDSGNSAGGAIQIKKQLANIAKNPLIAGVFAGILVLILKINFAPYIPEGLFRNFKFLHTSLVYIARAATPLSLFVLGGQFEFSCIKGFRKQIIVGTLCRVLIAPFCGIGIAILLCRNGILNFGPDVFAALISLFATPVAVASAIMVEEMENDGQLASQLVVWTSLISVFTLFSFIFISRMLGAL